MQEFKFCFVFAAKTHAVSLLIGSACRSIFLQTSRSLVGSSSELYPWVLQTIISINVCFYDLFQRNYFIFFHYSNTPPSPDCRKNVDYKPVTCHFEYITQFSFLTLTHRCTRFKPCDTGVICSANHYLSNMMSVTKNSNQNQLQQVEM